MSLGAPCLANFKPFGSSRRVPPRPFTLPFGVNGAGKSSVPHALAPAWHAVETGKLDVHRTRLGGDSIDLDGFGRYVPGRQRGQEVAPTCQLDPGDEGKPGHTQRLSLLERHVYVERWRRYHAKDGGPPPAFDQEGQAIVVVGSLGR